MQKFNNAIAVVIGDSHTNTLGLIRSLGEAKVDFILLLVCDEDSFCVTRSKYLKGKDVYVVSNMMDTIPLLHSISERSGKKVIICSNDTAAEFIDSREQELNKYFKTPLSVGKIGKYFNKANQCQLASECGLIVPQSVIYHKGDSVDAIMLEYPVLTKPLESITGSKNDIHICKNKEDLYAALESSINHCESFIIQEFIDKEYEINTLGVRTDSKVYWGGSIKKYRHNPPITGAAVFAQIFPVEQFNIEKEGIIKFLDVVGYEGIFSVEFLRKNEKNYFMEVNFRNDGLSYVSTVFGRNLPAFYVEGNETKNLRKGKPVYMMHLLNDLKLVARRKNNPLKWLVEFLKTDAFIDYNKKDIRPFWLFILSKMIKK